MKSCDFTAKGTSLRESTSFEPLRQNQLGSLTSRGEPEKKSESLGLP